MRAVKKSHIGLKRKTNEDNCGIYEELNLLAVADGMGGHVAGEVASRMALDLMKEFLNSRKREFFKNPRELLGSSIAYANNEIYRQAQEDLRYHGMGTTITVAYITDFSAFIAHIGDSRAYLIRDDSISMITSDHSLVNELLKNGGITKEEAQSHPQRNVLTRAMGTSPNINIDFYELKLQQGDTLLLCTDGLSNLVSPQEMKGLIKGKKDINDAADELVKLALERGGLDNISLVMGVKD